jgi:hypothetical protein
LADIFEKIASQSFGRHFSEKNAQQRPKISPKWRNFAQSGHTVSVVRKAIMLQQD